jgi:hypothetical protein
MREELGMLVNVLRESAKGLIPCLWLSVAISGATGALAIIFMIVSGGHING